MAVKGRGKTYGGKPGIKGGKLVVLEGIDGAGTSTQAELLCEWLKSRKVPTLLTNEPTDGAVGTLIRKALSAKKSEQLHPATLALLFAADRLEHIHRTVETAIKSGKVVISDRYKLSSIVYQSLELPLKWVKSINNFAPNPDITVVIDIKVESALKRLKMRGGKKEIFENRATLEKLRRKYKEKRLLEGEGKVIVIDGEKGIDEVFENILDAVAPILEME